MTTITATPDTEQLLARIREEITRRGGEVEITDRYRKAAQLAIVDRVDALTLVAAAGWRYYSRAFGSRRAALAYVYGPDDDGAGPWAVRVPATVTTVAQALAWLTPAQVKSAHGRGKRVARQGDVYAVETTPPHDGRGAAELPESHRWYPADRVLAHWPNDGRAHGTLHLPHPVRFVRQRAYGMGRGGGRGCGD